MKNTKKGFIVPLLIIIAVLAISGGLYYYSQKRSEIPQSVQNNTIQTPTSNPVLSPSAQNQTTSKNYTNCNAADSVKIDPAHFVNSASVDEDCLGNALLTCQPATYKFSGSITNKNPAKDIKIEGYDVNNNCKIEYNSSPASNPDSLPTINCLIPQSKIQDEISLTKSIAKGDTTNSSPDYYKTLVYAGIFGGAEMADIALNPEVQKIDSAMSSFPASSFKIPVGWTCSNSN